MVRLLIFLLATLLFASSTDAARILVASAADSKSHLRSILPVLNHLAEAGHHVHIFHITSEPKNEPAHANVTFIRAPLVRENLEHLTRDMGNRIWKGTMHSPMIAFVYDLMSKAFDEVVLRNNSDKLTSTLNSHWDLLFINEMFNVHGYGCAQLLNKKAGVPYVVFSPSMMMTGAAYDNALGHNWISHPHPFSPTPAHSREHFVPANFFWRLTNVLESLGEFGSRIYINKVALAPRLAKLTGRRDFSFHQLYADSELAMVDSIAHLALPQPEANGVLMAGAHCEQASPLSGDYKEFVEDPTSRGTIYVAFGTFIPWDYAPPGVADAFFDAFERLPDYRFIFSYRGKFPERKLSSHIRLVSWAPQLDILAHPKTLVFLTHCGLKSIKESLCSKTPMLAMPMFAEQNHNAFMVLEFGTGIALNKYNIDADRIYAGLKELLENEKYGKRVEKVQQIFLDRPMNPLDEGVFRVERIIKKGKQRMGRHFFKPAAVQMGWIGRAHV